MIRNTSYDLREFNQYLYKILTVPQILMSDRTFCSRKMYKRDSEIRYPVILVFCIFFFVFVATISNFLRTDSSTKRKKLEKNQSIVKNNGNTVERKFAIVVTRPKKEKLQQNHLLLLIRKKKRDKPQHSIELCSKSRERHTWSCYTMEKRNLEVDDVTTSIRYWYILQRDPLYNLKLMIFKMVSIKVSKEFHVDLIRYFHFHFKRSLKQQYFKNRYEWIKSEVREKKKDIVIPYLNEPIYTKHYWQLFQNRMKRTIDIYPELQKVLLPMYDFIKPLVIATCEFLVPYPSMNNIQLSKNLFFYNLADYALQLSFFEKLEEEDAVYRERHFNYGPCDIVRCSCYYSYPSNCYVSFETLVNKNKLYTSREELERELDKTIHMYKVLVHHEGELWGICTGLREYFSLYYIHLRYIYTQKIGKEVFLKSNLVMEIQNHYNFSLNNPIFDLENMIQKKMNKSTLEIDEKEKPMRELEIIKNQIIPKSVTHIRNWFSDQSYTQFNWSSILPTTIKPNLTIFFLECVKQRFLNLSQYTLKFCEEIDESEELDYTLGLSVQDLIKQLRKIEELRMEIVEYMELLERNVIPQLCSFDRYIDFDIYKGSWKDLDKVDYWTLFEYKYRQKTIV